MNNLNPNITNKDFKIRFVDFIFNHKWLVLMCALVIFLLSSYSATKLQFEEDIMKLLPDNEPFIGQYQQLLSSFNLTETMFIDIGTSDGQGVSEEQLIVVADAFVQQLISSPYFNKITYKVEPDEIFSAIEMLRKHRAAFFDENNQTQLTQKINEDAITIRLNKWKQMLTESPSPFLSQMFYSDPLGVDDVLLQKINALRSMGGPMKTYKGRLFSNDMKHLFIMAQPKYRSTDSFNSQKLVDFMTKSISSSHKDSSDSNVSIAYICGHRFAVENANRIKRDVKLTLSLSLIVIIILSLLSYRNPLLVLLSLLPAIFGFAFAIGLMRIFDPAISAISIGCGAMLIGISVDYGNDILYYSDQNFEGEKTKASIKRTVLSLLFPILLTAATAVVAFETLQLSIFPGYRQIGQFVSLGIIGTVGFALIVLPLLIPAQKRNFQQKPFLSLVDFFQYFLKWSGKFRKLNMLIIVLISLGALWGITKLQFEGDVQKLNAANDETKKDFARIINSFGDSMSSTYVVVAENNLQQSLEKNETVFSELNRMKEKKLIRSFDSISSIVPSIKTQNKNKLRWKMFWNEASIKQLKSNFHEACTQCKVNPKLVDEFVESLKNDSGNLYPNDLKSGFLNTIVSNQISESKDKSLILTKVTLNSTEDYPTFINQLRSSISNLIIYNGKFFVEYTIRLIYKELKRMAIFCFIFIFALLMLFFKGNLKVIIAILLPLLVSLFWTFGIMGWLGIPINIMNGIVSIFIFGLVNNYCIYFVTALKSEFEGKDKHVAITGGAITISALTTMTGLGSLALAKHPALHSLGLTAFLGIGSGLIAVLLIIPSFFYKSKKDCREEEDS